MKPVYVWDDVNDPNYKEYLWDLLENPKYSSKRAAKSAFKAYVDENALNWEPKLQITKISFEKVKA